MTELPGRTSVDTSLLPLHGVQDKRPRRLTREVVTIGRARGCDIGLEGPDISTLHCLLFRTPEGWRIRDCGSRTGTRVNGGPAREQLLMDGDVLHLGQFSFRVQQAPALRLEERPEPDSRVQAKLERSRRRLAEMALRWRRRVQAGVHAAAALDEAGLRRKEGELKARIRTYDNRLSQLEAAERELEGEKDSLRQERESHLERVRKVEGDLARRLEEVAEEIQQRRRDFQQRCLQEEGETRRRHAEEVRERLAEIQHREDQLAEGLRNLETRERAAAEKSAELEALADRLRREREDLMKEAPANRNGRPEETHPRDDLLEAEAALREQRKDLLRMMEQLKEMQQAIRAQQTVDVAALQRDNAELARMVEDLRTRPALEEVAALQRENVELARLVEELQARPVPAAETVGDGSLDLAMLQEMAALRDETDKLRGLLEERIKEGEVLRQALKDRNEVIARMEKNAASQPGGSLGSLDLDGFEAELTRERQQLEKDKAKLNAEIDQLRLRNQELDEATREMEMELSRERAELARERQRLDRMREEIRAETERGQREATMRESLAPVQKLREEIQGKKGSANGLSDRLAGFRNRLND